MKKAVALGALVVLMMAVGAGLAVEEQLESRILVKKMVGRRGTLLAKNGSGLDVVYILTRATDIEKVLLAVYVKTGAEFKVTSFPSGNYKCFFTHGVDWNPETKRFGHRAYYLSWLETLKFKMGKKTKYRWTISFGPIETLGPPIVAEARDVEQYGMEWVEETEFPRWEDEN